MKPNPACYPLANLWAVDESRFKLALECVDKAQAAITIQSINDETVLPMSIVDGIARIELTGIMTKRASIFQELFGGSSTEMVRMAFEAAVASDNVDGVLFVVDSPGGSVDGLAELGDVIFEARQQVRIHAHIDGLAASAAYYAASQAHHMTAGRMDMIGNIGTRMLLYDFSKLFDKEGIRAVSIDTGKYKSIGVMGKEITEEHESHLQELVDAMFADFVQVIMRGRGMSKSAVTALADGKMFMAQAAVANGLIDGMATIDQAEEALRNEINLNSERQSRPSKPAMRVGETKMEDKTKSAATEAVDQTKAEVTQSVASIGQLKAAFPSATSDFLVGCMEKNMSLDNAKDAWMAELSNQNAALQKQAEEAKANAEMAQTQAEAAAKAPGVEPLTTGSGAQQAADGATGGDAATEWHAAIKEQMARGKSKQAAVAHVRSKKPELRQRYVAQHNAEYGHLAAPV